MLFGFMPIKEITMEFHAIQMIKMKISFGIVNCGKVLVQNMLTSKPDSKVMPTTEQLFQLPVRDLESTIFLTHALTNT